MLSQFFCFQSVSAGFATFVNESILFLGADNTLYYPEAGAHIGPFRAYFELEL